MIPTAVRNAVFTLLSPSYRARLVEQAGGEIARECRAGLWQRVRCQTAGMSTPEIRGYARAYAAGLAAAQVDLVLDRRLLGRALRLRVLYSGIDQLVGMAVRDALSDETPIATRPMAA